MNASLAVMVFASLCNALVPLSQAAGHEEDERTGIDAIPTIDPGPAVQTYLARVHAEDWSRFELVEARWTNGEPVAGAVIGLLSGPGAPAANGTLILYADIERGPGPPARLPISVTVRPWVKAPVAVRDLAKGEILGSGDVRVEERPLLELRGRRPSGSAMDGAAPTSRLRVRTAVRAGEILTASSVEEKPLVAPGSRSRKRSRSPQPEIVVQ